MRLPISEERVAEEPALPLINIAFLLLIFFMLVGTIATPDSIKPADSLADQPQLNEGTLILIDSQAVLSIDGQVISLETLASRLASDAPITESGLDIRIKPDANLPARQLTQLLSVLRANGVQSVRVITAPVSK